MMLKGLTKIEWLVIIGVVALIIAIIMPSLQRYRESISGQNPCSSRLRQIGQAMLLYSEDHRGQCPASLKDLLGPDLLTQEVLQCPTDSVTHPTGESTYIYLSGGKDFKSLTADDVVAYEPLSVHEDGCNVLFGDGRVEWIEKKDHELVRSGRMPWGGATSQPTSQRN